MKYPDAIRNLFDHGKIMNPKLIIADECISALDVSIQAQVVNLMKDIQQETGTAYLFIAHDLSMVKYISDRRKKALRIWVDWILKDFLRCSGRGKKSCGTELRLQDFRH